MTITTDSAIAKEGFSASYTIRERSLPHEDEGEDPGEGPARRVALERSRARAFELNTRQNCPARAFLIGEKKR